MTKRTRIFMATAVGVLIVGLVTGLAASYFGIPALAQLGGDGPAELAYLPQDARLVAFANVRDVMDSELRRKIASMRPTAPDSADPDDADDNDFFDQAGIDIEQDVDRVVASLSSGGAATAGDRPLILARGRFDDDLIETLVRQSDGQVEDYQGTRLLTRTDDDETMSLAFVEPGLVAVGTTAAVKRAIDTKAGRAASITTNQEVMALVRDIDAGNAWAVGRFDAISGRARLPQELASQLPAINWFAASGHVNGGIEGLIRAETRDETAAQDLREVIRGFLALARLQTGQNAQLRAMMNSLELGGDGKTVSLSFSLPSEVIDALALLHQQRRVPASPGTAPAPPALTAPPTPASPGA
jgi:hypothetical protein